MIESFVGNPFRSCRCLFFIELRKRERSSNVSFSLSHVEYNSWDDKPALPIDREERNREGG